MSRLSHRNRTEKEIGIKNAGQFFDLVDNMLKTNLRLTDEEYDYIAEHATDEELSIILKEKTTFGEKRKIITILNKYTL